ncbi:pyroglutamyl-peptidase I [Microbacterium bovistercoris]|uniref:Pyroglutamyl-peptidase I n=1 Tax=Microbacterium bovistercoris TaxID=2293570 RepID=A0A371NVK0_9MICO|nr:pyroglutamyl-peptidase I [Microbacterium bovistercoris]REJ06633.1 pyroglutamyl-peptidase I [Microbacterium bovistercoris]
MTSVLLTGFGPFAGSDGNPSQDAVIAYAAAHPSADLVTAVLPVVFTDAADRLRTLIAEHRPEVVIAFGLAGGSTRVAVERVAVNLIDARIPDNSGAAPVDVPSDPGGPAARFATLPVKRIARAIDDAGIPAHVSLSAGSYVCNHVFYTALAAAPGARAGFIHLPWSASTAPEGAPHLPDDALARAVAVAVEHARGAEDARSAGTES